MSFLSAFPLLAIVVILYNLSAVAFDADLQRPLIDAALPTGAIFTLTNGEALVAFGLLLLYAEIFKATRTGRSSIMDHALSMGVFVVCLIEFLVVRRAGTGVFLILMLMTLLDVIAGFTVTITSARRDWGPMGR